MVKVPGQVSIIDLWVIFVSFNSSNYVLTKLYNEMVKNKLLHKLEVYRVLQRSNALRDDQGWERSGVFLEIKAINWSVIFKLQTII